MLGDKESIFLRDFLKKIGKSVDRDYKDKTETLFKTTLEISWTVEEMHTFVNLLHQLDIEQEKFKGFRALKRLLGK